LPYPHVGQHVLYACLLHVFGVIGLNQLAPNDAAVVAFTLANSSHALQSSKDSSFCSDAPPYLELETLLKQLEDAVQNDSYTALIRAIGQIFSNPDSLNQCFLYVCGYQACVLSLALTLSFTVHVFCKHCSNGQHTHAIMHGIPMIVTRYTRNCQ
jgi:hypothetical protein